MDKNFFSFTVNDAKGQKLALESFRGKVVLVVNVASKCGFTKQYEGLESIFEKYSNQGFTIIGFPCNQFGAQEPGSNEEIQSFCQTQYGVSFPITSKVDVNGSQADPVFSWLKSEAPGLLGTELIKWNFTKFLIGKDGKVIKRYAPQVEPQDMGEDIENALRA